MLSHKPWRAEAVIQLVAGVFVCLCLGVVTASLLHNAGAAGFKTADSFGGVLLATLSFQGAAWGLILIFLRQHQVRWRDAIGLSHPHLKKNLLLAAGFFILVLLVVLGLEQLLIFVLEKMGWSPADQRAVELFVNATSCWMRGYLAFFAMVLAPVAEEFIFRGVLFPFIKQLGWPKLAWFGVSFLFALVHLDAPRFAPLFVLALGLTWLYEITDCLLAPIIVHSLFNTTNLIILFMQNR